MTQEYRIFGIGIVTENSQSGIEKIGKLWQEFYQKEVLKKIPEQLSGDVFAIYYDYEKDHTKPYKFLIGCAVSDNAALPNGMIEVKIPKQNYKKFLAKGEMPHSLIKAWEDIWNSGLERKFGFDFEVHKFGMEVPEVEICISI